MPERVPPRTRLGSRLALALSFAVVALVAAPSVLAAGGSANVWVDKDGGSCKRGSARAYSSARACGSLGAAYRAAQAGDTVKVRSGTYGRQELPGGSKHVTIRNTPGTRPVLGTVMVRASNLTLIGFTISRRNDPGGTIATLEVLGNNNRLQGIKVNSRNIPGRQGIHVGGDGNSFKNGSTRNVVDEKGALVGGSDTTFNRFNFYDVTLTSSSVHNECVYSNGPRLTIKNSRFWHCATTDLFITRGDWWGQPLYGGVTLVNNVFEHSRMIGASSWHYYSLGINGGVIKEMRNWTVINNTFETEVSGAGTPAPGTIWANNIGSWGCFPQAVFVDNVGKKCSASDKAVSPAASCGPPSCSSVRVAAQKWVAPAKHNFRLRAGAPAINAASAAYAPSTDITGRRRPYGLRDDAGAYEYRP